ncbi:hypothetical protein [Sphingosinicella terrae]|uniref:hypothetical protein n=1 Tax=Sphingosinicella terrae TaxID=2172047 RepID=UPI000E0D09DD|nr:hypothetical protein [Sphingosinicella terrae]
MLKMMIEAYRTSGRFMRVLPLIVAIPVVAELVQHVVEWRTGMFDSYAMAEAVAEHPARMGFGHVKVAALFLTGYWAMRFLAFEGDARRTLRWDPTAIALFSLVLVFQALMTLVQDQAGSWLAAIVPAGGALLLAGFVALLVAMAAELYLAPWKAGAAIGEPHLHWAASFRLMRGQIGWSFGFTLAMLAPTMILHYLLNGLAIGRPPALAAIVLAADSLLVGYMAILLPAANYLVARRAAERNGARLVGFAPPVAREAQPTKAAPAVS